MDRDCGRSWEMVSYLGVRAHTDDAAPHLRGGDTWQATRGSGEEATRGSGEEATRGR